MGLLLSTIDLSRLLPSCIFLIKKCLVGSAQLYILCKYDNAATCFVMVDDDFPLMERCAMNAITCVVVVGHDVFSCLFNRNS